MASTAKITLKLNTCLQMVRDELQRLGIQHTSSCVDELLIAEPRITRVEGNIQKFTKFEKKRKDPMFDQVKQLRHHKNGSPKKRKMKEAIENKEPCWCICGQEAFGDMVGCDNEDCEVEWFHYVCVGVTEPPQGKWYCTECLSKKRKISIK